MISDEIDAFAGRWAGTQGQLRASESVGLVKRIRRSSEEIGISQVLRVLSLRPNRQMEAGSLLQGNLQDQGEGSKSDNGLKLVWMAVALHFNTAQVSPEEESLLGETLRSFEEAAQTDFSESTLLQLILIRQVDQKIHPDRYSEKDEFAQLLRQDPAVLLATGLPPETPNRKSAAASAAEFLMSNVRKVLGPLRA